MRFLVWLNWPEKCFRAGPADIRYLKSLLRGSGSKVTLVTTRRSFLKNLPSATHVITWSFEKRWYNLARSLEMLATPAAGRELVAGDPPPGVRLHYGGFHGDIMAENAAAFMLAWARGFFAMASRGGVRSGSWPRSWLSSRCFTLAGTRAVVIGYGKVGSAIGKKLSLLGVDVTGFSRKNIADLPAALKSARWVVLALPSGTGTDMFLSEKLIRRLPRTAVVINVGRGNAVDEKALLSALREKRIEGAYLDVFKNEPTFKASEDPAGTILSQAVLPSNLVTTPHSSAFSADYIRMCFDELKRDGMLG